MEDLADDLPESSPRYILLSHPLTTVRNYKLTLVRGMFQTKVMNNANAA